LLRSARPFPKQLRSNATCSAVYLFQLTEVLVPAPYLESIERGEGVPPNLLSCRKALRRTVYLDLSGEVVAWVRWRRVKAPAIEQLNRCCHGQRHVAVVADTEVHALLAGLHLHQPVRRCCPPCLPPPHRLAGGKAALAVSEPELLEGELVPPHPSHLGLERLGHTRPDPANWYTLALCR